MGKSEDNNELPRSTGVCRFCHQQRIIKTIGEITQAKADEMTDWGMSLIKKYKK